jgi:hypothetical protein
MDHICALQRMIYRLRTLTNPIDRARLEMVIGIYQRMYVQG